jgi:hypothetical protein
MHQSGGAGGGLGAHQNGPGFAQNNGPSKCAGLSTASCCRTSTGDDARAGQAGGHASSEARSPLPGRYSQSKAQATLSSSDSIDINVSASQLSRGAFIDLWNRNVVLVAGGLYRAKNQDAQIVIRIDPSADVKSPPIIGRLVRLSSSS